MWIGASSLLLILIYPVASFTIGSVWLQDLHWDETFRNLGRSIFLKKRNGLELELESWERVTLKWMNPEPQVALKRSDEGVVRAVAWLTGARQGPFEQSKRLTLMDGLLRRAVAQQIAAMEEVPYGRELRKVWSRELGRRRDFVLRLAIRTFARAWVKHTMAQLGLIAAAALFLGAFGGLCWWVVSQVVADGAGRRIAPDWTLITGALVTFTSVVAVAVALSWRLGHALFALFPKPATWFGRVTVAFVIFGATTLTLQFTLGITHVDPERWLSHSTTANRVVGLVLFLVTTCSLTIACARYAARKFTRAGQLRRISARLLAASAVVFLAPAIPLYVLASFGVRANAEYGFVVVVLFYVSVSAMFASGLVFVNECFADWRQLSSVGVRIPRWGFRRWQAWTGLGFVLSPVVIGIVAGYLAPRSIQLELSLVLNVIGLVGVLWNLVFGVLGAIFIIRVVVGLDELQTKTEIMAVTYVPIDRMGHFAMVRFPYEAHRHGRDSLIVPDPDQPGVQQLWWPGAPATPQSADGAIAGFAINEPTGCMRRLITLAGLISAIGAAIGVLRWSRRR